MKKGYFYDAVTNNTIQLLNLMNMKGPRDITLHTAVAFFLVIPSFFSFNNCEAQTLASGIDTLSANRNITSRALRQIRNTAYHTGEKLEFRIKYTGITAVTTEISVPKDTVIRGQDCYHIVYTAKTVPFFENFFPVNDRYESIIHKEGQYPMYFRQQIREGKFSHDDEVEFFHESAIARSYHHNKDFPMEAFTQDVISAYFFVRTLNLRSYKNDDVITIQNFSSDKSFPLIIKVRNRDLLETEIGTVRTIVLEPLVQGQGLFKSEGKILVWVTDDENKVPVKISMKVPVGSLYAEIISATGLKNPITSKLNE
ncbi:MAG: DUF3108 domain-containing protein [Chloroherpetonaceae bacterium]|nr:DUF3108 domain-containing protein [Chloroherpetonaceae bacterium]